MKKSLRLVLLVCASLVGLAFAAPALATFGPSLTVEQTSYKVGGKTTADVFIFAPQNDDAIAKLTILSPAGYGANLGAAPGTKIGKVVAVVKAKAIANAILPLAGDVLVANPADPAIVAAAARCTPSQPTHGSTWVLNTALQGQTIAIPVFVDKLGPLVTMQVCLPSPDVPQDQGGATFGAQLVSADFSVAGVFTNAPAKGGYEWAADFTPYQPGTATPVPTGTVEWRTYVGLPTTLTLARAKLKKHQKGLAFSGRLSQQGLNPKDVRLRLYYSKKANPAPTATSAGVQGAKTKRLAKLPRTGKFTVLLPSVKARTFFQVRFENYGTSCEGPSPTKQPIPCKGEDLAPITSNQLRVLPPPKKKHK